jgi:hypothetical protein
LRVVDWGHWQKPDVRTGFELKSDFGVADEQKLCGLNKLVGPNRIANERS